MNSRVVAGRNSKTVTAGAFLSLVIILTLGTGNALATQSAASAEGIKGTTPTVAELEQAYKQHCSRRSEIARKLSLLWFEERELKAEYEDTGREGALPDFYELAFELRQVREKIDAARAELSAENKVILAIGDLIPD